MAGYSGTPLIQKLGIKPGQRILIVNPPPDYETTLGPLPDGVEQAIGLVGQFDFIHFFTTERAEFEARYPDLRAALLPAGMLWISWPKKASKVPTDLTEDVIRNHALTNGLVDVKVAAIDAVWSGLKLVIRRKDRA
jgi:hypothetical protein